MLGKEGLSLPEWSKTESGALTRKYTGKLGERIVEYALTSDRGNWLKVERKFPSAIRNHDYLSEGAEIKTGDSFRFTNRKDKSFTTVELDKETLAILIKRRGSLDMDFPSLGFRTATPHNSLVNLGYSTDGLLRSCQVQAEEGAHAEDNLKGIHDPAIQMSILINEKSYSQFLTLEFPDASRFRWIETAAESSHQEGSKEKLVNEGVTSYGEKIVIQDNAFVIARYGNTISVMCSSAVGKDRWTAEFPLRVDMGKIKAIFDDPECDFRPLRDFLSARLKINE